LSGTEQASTLRDYLQIARRRRWIILAVVAVTTLGAAFFSLRQDELYEASAEVLVRSGFDSSQSPERVLQTQADLAAASSEVARRVRNQLDLDRAPPIDVSPKTESDILIFSSTASSPRLAARAATAYARAFRDFQRELVTRDIRKALRDVEAEIQEVLARPNPDPTLYGSLLDKREELRTLEALETSRAFLVRPATPGVQVQPKPVRNTLLGLVLGLILGLGLAFLRDTLDTRVRSTDEVEEHLGIPLLVRVPRPLPWRGRSNQLVMINDPDGPGAEPFRILRANVVVRANVDFARKKDAGTLLVTSAVEGEGKSTTAANLAVALARDGRRVALVDFDLRRPFIHRFFDLDGPGVTQVAIGEATLEEALVPIALGWPGTRASRIGVGNGMRQDGGMLQVLPAGSIPEIHAGSIPESLDDVLPSHVVADILDDLRDRADIVLVDSTPLVVGDAMALTSFVDAVLIVTRMDTVRRPMLRELKRILDVIPAKAIGFVATGVKSDVSYSASAAYYPRSKPRAQEPVA
jgi:polysaccharide biosynthesis transport protein